MKEIVHFYNTAGVAGLWPEPEAKENVNRDELGNLGLTEEEEWHLVAFLKTLTDRFDGRSYPPVGFDSPGSK